MSLIQQLKARAAEHKPVRVAIIGAGKFGSMYLAQIPRTPGVHLVGIADLSPGGARANLARVGWAAERLQAKSLDEAVQHGRRHRMAAGETVGTQRQLRHGVLETGPRPRKDIL